MVILTLSRSARPWTKTPQLQKRPIYFWLLSHEVRGDFSAMVQWKCVLYTSDCMYLHYLFLPKLLKIKLHLNKSINMKYVFMFLLCLKCFNFNPNHVFPKVCIIFQFHRAIIIELRHAAFRIRHFLILGGFISCKGQLLKLFKIFIK